MVKHFDAQLLHSLLKYPQLVDELEKGFRDLPDLPKRSHLEYGDPKKPSTMLLMPAWNSGDDLGVKIVTVTPGNADRNLPLIQGIYLFFSQETGEIIATMDAKAMTNIRTAATSALASKYLSRPDSTTLLMVGTGALAPEMIRAHCAVRPIREVMVWGRDYQKAQDLAAKIQLDKVSLVAIRDIDKGIEKADIITSATTSINPVLKGELFRAGQHIDLVGSYRKNMREMDDEGIKKCKVFIDTEGALGDTGDLVIPLSNGTISQEDILSTLNGLITGSYERSSSDITCFKSVGHAIEDLVAARLVIEKHNQKDEDLSRKRI